MTATRKKVSTSSGEVTQADLSRITSLSTRQIRNLESRGLPHSVKGKRKYYPVPEAVTWWKDREVERAVGAAEASPLEELKARKLEAEVYARELELAQKRGDLIHVSVMARQVGEVFARLRARLVAMKGSVPPRITGLDKPREASKVFGPIIDETIADLLQVVEGFADEEEGRESVA